MSISYFINKFIISALQCLNIGLYIYFQNFKMSINH